MTRNELLGEITSIAGEVFKELEAKGIEFSQRQVIMFTERFCAKWRALPEPERTLAKAVLRNEVHDGGLLTKDTVRIAGVVDSRYTR